MSYVFTAKVKPNSPEFCIEKSGDGFVICTKSPPENNRANMEIVKELGKALGRDVKIIRGMSSKNKTILIEGHPEDLRRVANG